MIVCPLGPCALRTRPCVQEKQKRNKIIRNVQVMALTTISILTNRMSRCRIDTYPLKKEYVQSSKEIIQR